MSRLNNEWALLNVSLSQGSCPLMNLKTIGTRNENAKVLNNKKIRERKPSTPGPDQSCTRQTLSE